MDFLYFCFDPLDDKPDEFKQNIAGRAAGVRRLGYRSDYIYYNQNELVYVVKDETKHFSVPDPCYEVNDTICSAVCGIIKENSYDFLYLNGSMLNSKVIKIARCAKEKKFSAKVVFEPEYFPINNFCGEFVKKSKGQRTFLGFNRAAVRYRKSIARMPQAVDTIAVMDVPCTEACSVPAISAYAGIDVGAVNFSRAAEGTEAPVSILGVVTDGGICGYERIFTGLKDSGRSAKHYNYSFDIAGKEEDTAELKRMASDFWPYVNINFLGEKTCGEIAELCGTHSVAVSDLGCYKRDIVYSSPCIAKLYCAAGIPFIYAYEDISLDRSVRFALNVANNSSPVSADVLQSFVLRCRLDSRLAQAERRYAEDKYDWWVIMKHILGFTATGRREA